MGYELVLADPSDLTGLADMFRKSLSTTETYSIEEMTNIVKTQGIGGGGGVFETEELTVTPSETTQIKTPTKDGYSKVTVNPISSTYVGSGITQNPTITVSGDTVTVPSGYYSSQKTKSVSSGALGTVSATKGSVTDNSITITPSISNGTAGYITATSKSGNAVTVTASELVSGNKALTPTESNQTNIDVTNYKTASVSAISNTYVGSAVPTQGALSITPTKTTQTALTSGVYTTGAISVAPIPDDYIIPSGSQTITQNNTYNVNSLAQVIVNVPTGEFETEEVVVTATEEQQILTPTTNGYSKVTVSAIPDNYVGSAIDVNPTPTASGNAVTIPIGYYNEEKTKSVQSGSLGTVSASKGTVSNNSVVVTPSISGGTAGYITQTSKSGSGVTISASELVSGNKALSPSATAQNNVDVTNYATVSVSAIPSDYIGSGVVKKGAETFTPTTTNQTISANQYLNGTQTILGDENLLPENIVKNKTIFGVVGSHECGGFTTEELTVSPTEEQQIKTPTTNGYSKVTINAIPSDYIGSDITVDPTPTASGATVTIPSGYYSSETTKNVSSGTLGTVIATKGTVSGNSISITPSISGGSAGYISNTSKSGEAVTVSASELVSGNKSLTPTETAQTNIDVTNYATASVGAISSTYVGSGVTRQAAKTVTPTKSTQTAISSGIYTTGDITVGAIPDDYIIPRGSTTKSANGTYDVTSYAEVVVDVDIPSFETEELTVTPTESQQVKTPTKDGYSKVTVNAIQTETKTATVNGDVTPTSGKYLTKVTVDVPIPTFETEELTVTPSESEQVKTPTKDGYSKVTVGAISSTYIGSGITQYSTSGNTTLNGTTTTKSFPAGYYSNAHGATHSTVNIPDPTISVSSSGLITASGSWTAGFTTDTSYSNTSQLTTKGTTTITPSSSQQTAISSGTYATGNIVVSAVPTETKSVTENGTVTPTSGKYLSSVTVAIPLQHYYTGSSTPSSSLGEDGDIYLMG